MENPEPAHQSEKVPPGGTAEVRRLSVIMFTDMVGYSSLTQRNEALALELLEEHRRIVRPILVRHGGREIKTIGDAFLVEFLSALAAARCAVEIQQAHHDRNAIAAASPQILIRIGLHAGDVVCRENDVFGDGVNIAARIEPLAEAGGICVSEDVARQVQNKLGCPLVKLGTGELKNITLPVNIYRIVLPWQKPRAPSAERLAFFFRKKSTRRGLVAAILGLLAATALVVWSPSAAPVNRLAVLPLVNFSGDARDEYFADGMTEELISSLSAIRELDVIARTSIAQFKGTQLDITKIGKALNVGSIIEGSVLIAGDDARININLISVRTQKTLWTQEFTRKMKDVFAIQSAIATSVAEALKIQLLAGEHDLLEHRGTDNNAAYREYLLGKSHLNQKTGVELVKAIESFQRAVDQDPSFALAYAGLAEAYTLVGNAGYGGSLPREDAIAQARASAAQAIRLDDSLAEAHLALGYVKFRIDWDWAGAEKEFKHALQLKPGYARAHEVYALYLAIQLRLNEAMLEMQRARQLDPLSASVSNGLGRILHFQRKFPEAIAQFKQTLKLDPNYAEAQFSIGMSYLADGRYEEAIVALQEAIRMSNQRLVMISMLGLAEGRAGKTDAARKILAETQQSEASPSATNNAGLVHLGLGEPDAALQAFAEAVAAKEGTMIYMNVDPVTNVLRPDPRFQALIRKMGLPVSPPATP